MRTSTMGANVMMVAATPIHVTEFEPCHPGELPVQTQLRQVGLGLLRSLLADPLAHPPTTHHPWKPTPRYHPGGPMFRTLAPSIALTVFLASPGRGQELQFADLGSCPLESGEVIEDCRLGYRTVGTLDADSSNVVLFPTWFGGTTENILPSTGENGWIDSDRFFVIMVDAFGNGVSSSPSNSLSQPGAAFPEFGIRDMVTSQHRLITEHLGLRRVKAVVGVSMGGMQTFEWAVSYPDFLEKALPIVGSPRLATYDIVLWETYRRILEWSLDCSCQLPAAVSQGLFFLMGGPDYHARVSPRDRLDEINTRLEEADIEIGRAWDLRSQLLAMISHDVSSPFDGSMEDAASQVQADFLIVVGLTDHVVTPGPALDFGQLFGAESLALANDCGHSAHSCAPAAFRPRVDAFLKR